MAKKNSMWDKMYKYKFTDKDMAAATWCINNAIHISPHPIMNSQMFHMNITIRGKPNISEKKFTSDEVIFMMYKYYNYYYNKRDK